MLRGWRKTDGQVRIGGAALLLLSTGLVALTASLRGSHGAQPSVTEFCIAFLAVCSASIGAAMLFEGHKLFQPAQRPRGRQSLDTRSDQGAAR